MIVLFTSQEWFKRFKPMDQVAVISITEPGEALDLDHIGWDTYLQMGFIVDPQAPHVFDEEMANKIAVFVDGLGDGISVILIHCLTGVRSAAVAKAIAQHYGTGFNYWPAYDVDGDTYEPYNKHVYRTLAQAFTSMGV